MIQTTDNAKVTVKPLTQGQTLLNMLGYVQKDYGHMELAGPAKRAGRIVVILSRRARIPLAEALYC